MSLSFFRVDSVYCDFLRAVDSRVPYTMNHKSTRPFIGIVLSVNGFQYYVPLTSPKPKHLGMRNTIDFLKINNGVLGAINFNNMIPVIPECLSPVYLNIMPGDSQSDAAYKRLLGNQLTWCNSHKTQIEKQARNLYSMIVNNKAPKSLVKRCCDFSKIEIRSKQYIK